MTPAAGEPPLAARLRAWARGIYPDEAGVELLIGHAVFLDRADFASRFITIPGDGDGLVLRVTQGEHGGDTHDEHVETVISGG